MVTNAKIKRIICLANSRRPGGRCIAGKEILADRSIGSWVRPVSAGLYEAVSDQDRRYRMGGEPQVLDVIDIPILRAQPEHHQQENWLIDNRHRWVKIGRITVARLNQYTDPPADLWPNGDSTLNGLNDRVPMDLAHNLRDSLRLIPVNALTLSVSAPGSAQGEFQFNGINYRLRVTDPNYHRRDLQQHNDDIQIENVFLTISLGGTFDDGYNYKFIAAIIK